MKMTIAELKSIKDKIHEMLDYGFSDWSKSHKPKANKLRKWKKIFEDKLQKELDAEELKKVLDAKQNSGLEEAESSTLESSKELEEKKGSKEEKSDLVEPQQNELDLDGCYRAYITALSIYFGGQPKRNPVKNLACEEIIHLIMTITPDNQEDHQVKLSESLSDLDRKNVGDRAFCFNAFNALLYMISPNLLNRDLSVQAKEIRQVQLSFNPAAQSNFNKDSELLGTSTPIISGVSSDKKESKPESESISEDVLLDLINFVGKKPDDARLNQLYSDTPMSMLDQAIAYYGENEHKLKKDMVLKNAFDKFIIKLFDSYITPEILHKIIGKEQNISVNDENALRLGQALLGLSRLEDSTLFHIQVKKLMDTSDNIVGELKRSQEDWNKDYSTWVSHSLEVTPNKKKEKSNKKKDKRNKNQSDEEKTNLLKDQPKSESGIGENIGASERRRKITKIIMLPMLKDLDFANGLITSLNPDSKASSIPANVDEATLKKQLKKRYPHHSKHFIEQSFINSKKEGEDEFESKLYNDPSFSFVQEMQGILHASLFTASNSNPHRESRRFERTNAFAAAQAVDALHNLIKGARDENLNKIDELMTKAQDKYIGMYPQAYRDESREARNWNLFKILTISLILAGLAVGISFFCPPLMGLIVLLTAAKVNSFLAFSSIVLCSSFSLGYLIAGLVKFCRPSDYYLKNLEPCKNANSFFSKAVEFNKSLTIDGNAAAALKVKEEKEAKTIKGRFKFFKRLISDATGESVATIGPKV